MTEQEIMQLAVESGMFAMLGPLSNLLHHEIVVLQRFVNMVAEREREACAQIIERNAAACDNHAMLRDVLMSNAAAIRARGGKGAEC